MGGWLWRGVQCRPTAYYSSSLRLLMPEYECMYMGTPYLEHTYPRGQLEADLLLELSQQYRPRPA